MKKTHANLEFNVNRLQLELKKLKVYNEKLNGIDTKEKYANYAIENLDHLISTTRYDIRVCLREIQEITEFLIRNGGTENEY